MLRKLRPRSIYDVMAAIGCFAALATGTAYAANTIGSADIIDGEVKSVDIGDGEVKSADVKDQSLTTFDVSTFLGADVVDDTLTGADIQESTLAKVPSSANSDSLGGQSLAQVQSSIIARPRGDQAIAAGPNNAPVTYPLTANSWTQPANSVELLYGQMTVTAPTVAACDPINGTDPATGGAAVSIVVTIDGQTRAFVFSGILGSGTQTFDLSPLGQIFSPDASTQHSAAARVSDTCQAQHYTVNSVRLYVPVFR